MMGRLREKRLTQKEAAEILAPSIQQVKRVLSKYCQGGASGLVSQRRGKPGHNQLNGGGEAKGVGFPEREI
jgi:hypothetical protein